MAASVLKFTELNEVEAEYVEVVEGSFRSWPAIFIEPADIYGKAESLRAIWDTISPAFDDRYRNPQAFFQQVFASPPMIILFRYGKHGIAWLARRDGDQASVGLVFEGEPDWREIVREHGGRKTIAAVLKWAMQTWDLDRIDTTVPMESEGSIRFLKRCGFTQEGELRRAGRYDGETVDVGVFGLLKEDLDA